MFILVDNKENTSFGPFATQDEACVLKNEKEAAFLEKNGTYYGSDFRIVIGTKKLYKSTS